MRTLEHVSFEVVSINWLAVYYAVPACLVLAAYNEPKYYRILEKKRVKIIVIGVAY